MSETIQDAYNLDNPINLEFAPMEGITGYIFRQAHAKIFGKVDRYYSPFIAPGASHKLSSREKNEILPEHNRGLKLIPQVLTHSSEDFLWLCGLLAEYGYDTVNLNLGCPSATVVTKKKGAGFLDYPDELNLFLDEICSGLEKITASDGKAMRLSIKTRIGMKEETEFSRLIEIYNQYPLNELIVHPRVREDYYNGSTRMEAFYYAMQHSRSRLCYNGNLFSAEETKACMDNVFNNNSEAVNDGKISALMFGRGAVATPWIFSDVRKLFTKKNGCNSNSSSDSLHDFRAFHDLLLDGYAQVMSGDRNTLFKMKELWYYFRCHFPNCEKNLKKIKKSQNIADYRAAVESIFNEDCFRI